MKKPSCCQRFLPFLTALILCLTAGTLLAQEERWLLIFDTSANMKKRLPAMDLEVTKLFLASSGQHIHAGDSVGVWAFGNNHLHAGELPLITYDPSQAGAISTNVLHYVHSQKYDGATVFDPLTTDLDAVVKNSQRLTILIFCDGEGEIQGTPYDYAINQDMLGSIPGQKKIKQPVLVILRTQKGKYVGGTVNLPPEPSSVPEFPPLPAPPKPAPVVAAAPVAQPAPEPALPALIINGTAISTNPDAIPAYVPKPHVLAPTVKTVAPAPSATTATATAPATPAPVATASAPVSPAPAAPTPAPAPAVAQAQTVPVPAPTPTPAVTPAATTPVANASATAPASDSLAPSQNIDLSTKILLVVGGTFFGMALLLVVLFFTRRKQPPASLITSIMTEDPNRR